MWHDVVGSSVILQVIFWICDWAVRVFAVNNWSMEGHSFRDRTSKCGFCEVCPGVICDNADDAFELLEDRKPCRALRLPAALFQPRSAL